LPYLERPPSPGGRSIGNMSLDSLTGMPRMLSMLDVGLGIFGVPVPDLADIEAAHTAPNVGSPTASAHLLSATG
jgi:hypothetical protein